MLADLGLKVKNLGIFVKLNGNENPKFVEFIKELLNKLDLEVFRVELDKAL